MTRYQLLHQYKVGYGQNQFSFQIFGFQSLAEPLSVCLWIFYHFDFVSRITGLQPNYAYESSLEWKDFNSVQMRAKSNSKFVVIWNRLGQF